MAFYLAEFSFFGIAVVPAVPMLLLAVIPTEIARRILIRLRITGAVWNWPLLVLAVYALIVSGLILTLKPL